MKLGILAAFILVGLVAFGQPAAAARKTPSGTIAIAAGSDLRLGGVVSFDYTVDGGVNECYPYGTNKCARIQVVCYQGDAAVYAAAEMAPFNSFVLGGGSSAWLTNGGPATCEATLYYWQWHPVQTFVPLAPSITFEAAGS